MTIKGVKIGGSSRMKVLAEVVDATTGSGMRIWWSGSDTSRSRCRSDRPGRILGRHPASVKRTLKNAREVTALPISIDAVRPETICAGIEAGADMILSLNGENLPLVGAGWRSGYTGSGHTDWIRHPGGEPKKAKNYSIQIIAIRSSIPP